MLTSTVVNVDPFFADLTSLPTPYPLTNPPIPSAVPICSFNGYYSESPCKKSEKPDRPPIAGVETFNNRAVIVHFADGSFTKSVCGADDTFDLDVGITICLLKRALSDKDGTKRYNNLLRKIHKMMKRDAERKEQEAAEKEAKARKVKKKKAKAIAKRERRLSELGNVIRKAIDDSAKEEAE